MQTIIQTQSLSKRYGEVSAVSDNSISVQKGEIYGFLGLNGAGKTTTIRMLIGLVRPTSGKAFLFNQPVQANNSAIWEKVGYLVEVPHAYPNLTVRENLELIRTLRKIKDKQVVDSIMETLALLSYANRKTKNLSLGNKQRLGLAKALIHNPEVLILDEPTNGLDPAGIHDVRELLIDLAENHGVTIFISSHILGEIALVAKRIGIIHQGKMIQELRSEELESLSNKRLVVHTNNNKEAINLLKHSNYKALEIEQNQILIQDERALNSPADISKMLIQQGLDLHKINTEQENLEAYFLRIIKEKEV